MSYFGHVLSGYHFSLCLFTDQSCACGLHMEIAGKLHLARYNDSVKPPGRKQSPKMRRDSGRLRKVDVYCRFKL